MARPSIPIRPNRLGGALLIVAAVLLVAALLLPNAFAGAAGRLVADLWITVMGAVAGLIGGMFGG